MWPFKAGMFLNFLLHIVHSTGFSDELEQNPLSDEGPLLCPMLLEVVIEEILGMDTFADGFTGFWGKGKDTFSAGVCGNEAITGFCGKETIFPPRDSFNNCSMS